MNIQKIKLEQLLPAEYNPRKDLKPGDNDYEKLKKSIETYGYTVPIIWNKATGTVSSQLTLDDNDPFTGR